MDDTGVPHLSKHYFIIIEQILLIPASQLVRQGCLTSCEAPLLCNYLFLLISYFRSFYDLGERSARAATPSR